MVFLENRRAETMILNLIEQLEASKTDSILDLGLSKLEHRENLENLRLLNGYQVISLLKMYPKTRLKQVMK
jgi:hypothetical protein